MVLSARQSRDLVPIASSAYQGRLASVSALVLQIYDWLLCLDQEVELIWSSQRTAENTLYQMVRYGALSGQIFQAIAFIHTPLSASFCTVLLYVDGIFAPFGALSSRIIMLRRVSALYNNSKRVLHFLYAALLVQLLGEVLIVIFTYFYLDYVQDVLGQPMPGVPFYVCLTTRAAPYFWIYWLFAIIYDLILCIFVFAKGYISYKRRVDSSFLRLIVRDSILYYLGVLAIEIITLILWAKSKGTSMQEMEMGNAFVLAIEPILCCRLVLNTRSTLRRPTVTEVTTTDITAYEIQLKAYRNRSATRKHHLDSMGLPQLTELEVRPLENEEDIVRTRTEDPE